MQRILAALHEGGGALLADPPGAGKTITALGVAAKFGAALVLAPAALRGQWESSARRAQVSIRFVSLEAMSRGAAAPASPLIIVDEAHHLRSSVSIRYRRVAALCIGTPVLLLTATPVVNRRAERDALLALFLGTRAAALGDAERARLIVRREVSRPSRPLRRAAPIALPDPQLDVATALRSLPAPWPTADGAAAAGLIRTTLAMAWASSAAALDAALRRRLQRGESLAEELAQARWPSRRQLRQWLVGDDATQLALALPTAGDSVPPPREAVATMRGHLAAVQRLRAQVQAVAHVDTQARASALRRLIERHAPGRIVCFAQHAETVRALYRALAPMGGIVAIVGHRVLAAQGRWSRDEVLAQFATAASDWSPADIRGVRCLLSTDVLAEGVELPQARVVVHLDPAWTPARLEQREGRAARPGAVGAMTVYRFALPRGAQALLRLGRRLRRKQRARADALSAAHSQSALQGALAEWLGDEVVPDHAPRVAAVRSTDGDSTRFLALLRSGNRHHLIGGHFLAGKAQRSARWKLSQSPAKLLQLVRAAEGSPAPCPASLVTAIRGALQRYLALRRARGATAPAASGDALPRLMRRRLDEALAQCSLSQRERLARRWSEALRSIASSRSAGVWEAARAALAHSEATAALEALSTLADRLGADRADDAAPWRLSALLVLLP